MANVNPNKNPYGLQGGTYLEGGASGSGLFYTYYPISDSDATICFTNIVDEDGNRVTLTGTFTAGVPIYGEINCVIQTSGRSFMYNANKSAW